MTTGRINQVAKPTAHSGLETSSIQSALSRLERELLLTLFGSEFCDSPFSYQSRAQEAIGFFQRSNLLRGASFYSLLNVPRTLRFSWSWFHSKPDSGGLPVPPHFENVQPLHSQGITSRNFVLGFPHLSNHIKEGLRFIQTCTQLLRFTDPGFLREATISQMEPSPMGRAFAFVPHIQNAYFHSRCACSHA